MKMKAILATFFVSFCLHAAEPWMSIQIDNDLSFFRKGYCQNCLYNAFLSHSENHNMCLIISKHRERRVDFIRGKNLPPYHERFLVIKNYFTDLLRQMHYPSTVILVAVGDSWSAPVESPVWVMCKLKGDNKILFPDFAALDKRYNVIDGIDLEKTLFPIA